VKRSWPESLKPVIVVLIALLAGPELFLGMELLALLDLLGVGLFLLAYLCGVRLALSGMCAWLRPRAVPVHLLARPLLAEIRTSPRLLAMAVPVSLFYLSWAALGILLAATGAGLQGVLA
jgi:hypothetical protein